MPDYESSIVPLWKYSDVANYLCLSQSHVRRLVSRGVIPSMKIVGCRRFDREEIEAWAQSFNTSRGGSQDDTSSCD